MKKIFCATYETLDAKMVSVESTLTKGLPSFNIVGMANTAITESKERVKSALLSNSFVFPPKRITINLSPSDLKKEGSHFDLAIALLIALDNTDVNLDGWYVFGELGLDGSVKENQLLFPLVLSLARQNNIDKVIVPHNSLERLQYIPNIQFYGVHHLNDAMALLKGESQDVSAASYTTLAHPNNTVNGTTYYHEHHYPLDFSDVRGQEIAKRAALISAAGMHNILLEGSPGSGKSMIAKRLRYILPPIDEQELLEISKLQSLEGMTPDFRPQRPFRSPHHSSTLASIFGGGTHRAQIGEVGLSHLGILFFDELPHYSKQVLEALREPLEDQKIRISRVHSKIEYPSNFIFVGAMNPCPCGNLLHSNLQCRCSDVEITRYKNRLSDPFLDRIDLYVTMSQVSPDDRCSFNSRELHEQVLHAHRIQKSRNQHTLNGKLSDQEIDRFCQLDSDAQQSLDQATHRFSLSFRSINKIKKTARTIADLDNSEHICKKHLLEALSFRRR